MFDNIFTKKQKIGYFSQSLDNLDYTKTSFSDFIPGKTNSNTALIARFVSKVGGFDGTEGSDLYSVSNNKLIEIYRELETK